MSDLHKQDLTRRDFLKNTALGAAATGLGALAASAMGADQAGAKVAKPLLPHGVLGRTGYPVTRVSFGAILISEQRGTRVLKAAIDSGVNLVHVAAGYVHGQSIVAVGELFKADKTYRDKVFLCVKSVRPQSEGELDEMLKILGTDHADALCTEFQNPEPGRIELLQKQQDALKKKGKLRHTGFVCHGDMNGVMEMILEKAPKYFDVALIATAPLSGSGGRSRRGAPPAQPDRFAKNLRALRAAGVGVMSMKSGAQKAIGQGAAVFGPHVKTILAAGADTVLTSFNSAQHIETVKELKLDNTTSSPAEKRAAAEFHESRAGACIMCAGCAKACPNGVPVNDLMRIRMYNDERGWTEHARAEFESLGPEVAALTQRCGDCSVCAGVCPVGHAGPDEVRRIGALFA